MVDQKKYWIEIAQYDIDTARVMFNGKRFLYVGFMCHQVIEKILKAYFVQTMNETPPYIHNLTVLAKKSGIYAAFSEEQKDLIDILEPLNIEARYPTTKEKLMQSLNKEKCESILQKTEVLFLWIKTKL